MTTVEPRPVEAERMEEMLGRFTTDFGAALSFPLVLAGERLGLFGAMADGDASGARGSPERRERDVRGHDR